MKVFLKEINKNQHLLSKTSPKQSLTFSFTKAAVPPLLDKRHSRNDASEEM